MWSVKHDEVEGTVDCRVSDWDGSIENAHTGRQVVHQFTVVSPAGNNEVVSAESVAGLLGWTNASQPKEVTATVSAAKTLAKQQMALASVEGVWGRMREAVEGMEAAGYPEMRKESRTSKWDSMDYVHLVMGDVAVPEPCLRYYDFTRRPLEEKLLDYMKGVYLKAKLGEMGFNYDKVKAERLDMLKKVHRQEIKMGLKTGAFKLTDDFFIREYLR